MNYIKYIKKFIYKHTYINKNIIKKKKTYIEKI